ncbi:MAG: hypothetical protein ACLFP2_00040 [Candidatus Woesearchaeota archaeon]
MAEAPPQKQKGFNLFGGHEKAGPDPELKSLRHDFSSLSRRLRELEERTQNLRKKIQMADQNFMSQNKKNIQGLRDSHAEINELKKFMNDLDNKLLLLIKELRMCARKEDVNELERYINIWEPINFVTRKEVEKILHQYFESMVEDVTKKTVEKILKDRKL